MVKGKPNTLTFLVSFHQQFLNAYYRSLEGESYKCGKAKFTLRRLNVMPTTNKEQKNSAVVETHLTTKLPRRTSYRGALGINSTIPSYLARRRKSSWMEVWEVKELLSFHLFLIQNRKTINYIFFF